MRLTVRDHRRGLLAATLVLGAGLTQAIHPAQAPAAGKPIQPGAAVCLVGGPLDDGACGQFSTLNFVFKDRAGRRYIGAAAHNFAAVRDRATIRGDAAPFGRVVVDDDSVDFLHPGDPPNPQGTDFALVRIRHSRAVDIRPRVRSFGGPTGYTTPRETAFGDTINAFGQGRPDLMNPTGPRSGQLLFDSHRAFASTVPESGGDSGMPYVHAKTGKALGVNAICGCGVEPGLYPTVRYLLERMKAFGFRLKLVRAR